MENNTLTLDKVMASKVYISEKSHLTFGSPRDYIGPFVDKLAGLPDISYRVETSDRVANKDSETLKVNEAFGRVLVEAKFPKEYCLNAHDLVIGMVYALDVQKPIIKIYAGYNAWACSNLSIFRAKNLFQIEILQGVESVYEKAMEYISEVSETAEHFRKIYKIMTETYYATPDEINRVIGYLLRQANSNKQIGTNIVLAALKDLEDKSSKYAIIDGRTNQWNIYNALTQYITDKVDILDKANKTSLISNLFVHSN